MQEKEYFILKIKILCLSILLTLIGIGLYFLDTSLNWGIEKIVSCIIINIWLFFMIPAFRGSYLSNKEKSLREWFEMGFHFGISKICLPALFSPVYGIRYYLFL